MSSEAKERQQFERWISSPPYERSVSRFGGDEARHAWPGQYKQIAVQLAWEAWKESKIQQENNE